MKITPIQKKTFHKILVANDIDWEQFDEIIIPKTDDHIEYSRLVHKPSELFFGFYHNEIFDSLYPNIGGWYVEFSPGERNVPLSSHPTVKGWEGVIELIKVWADLIKNEIAAFDFLNQLNKYHEAKIINQGVFEINKEDIFQKEEEVFIRNQLSEFNKKIEKLDIVQTQLIEIQKRIEYLNSRLDKQYPKVDWINIFVGTLVGSLTTEGIESIKDPNVIEHLKLLFHTVTSGRFLQ